MIYATIFVLAWGLVDEIMVDEPSTFNVTIRWVAVAAFFYLGWRFYRADRNKKNALRSGDSAH